VSPFILLAALLSLVGLLWGELFGAKAGKELTVET